MDNYNNIVKKYSPREDIWKNAIIVFIFGGLLGLLAEVLLNKYIIWFQVTRKMAGVFVTITLIFISSILTALGIFDTCVSKLRCALIIPITGFAHSITSAALEYRREGLILGIGSNIFKLAGSVILYGIVSVYILGIIRLFILGV